MFLKTHTYTRMHTHLPYTHKTQTLHCNIVKKQLPDVHISLASTVIELEKDLKSKLINTFILCTSKGEDTVFRIKWPLSK